MKKESTKEEKDTRVNYFAIFGKTIVTVIKSIPRLCVAAWSKSNPQSMSNSEYMELTPSKVASNSDEYFKALDLAISNPDIKNIALTGPYGSGKSSIICSYINQRPTIKAINISLATFFETKLIKETNQGGRQSVVEKTELVEFAEDELEKGILKQLFYKVKYRKIPQSRYRKIHRHGWLRTILFVAVMVLTGTISTWLLGNDYLFEKYQYACERIKSAGCNDVISHSLVWLFIIIVLLIASYLIWMVSTRIRLASVKLADKVEVSTKDADKETVFSKNLDEIIYFFESTDYEVVFIEDLDRFKNNEIYIKLRELNMLINNYEMIKRKVVFVYAIRDDMFENTDRTKFFDFIIPIIPYINSTNSNEIMRDLLGIGAVDNERFVPEHKVSDRFVTLIAPYIGDMRVLTSIINEFWIYIATIKGGQKLPLLKDENMLALMVFKNMYPKDFAKIEDEKGIIKQAFEDKKVFVKKQKKPLEEIVNKNVDLLNDIEQDILKDISELKVAFLGYLVGFTGIATSVIASNSRYYIAEIMSNDFDFNALNVKSMRVENKTSSAQQNPDLYDVFNEDPVVIEYFARYNALLNSAEERKEELKHVLEESRKKLRNITEESIRKLIGDYSAEEVLSEQVRKNDLLVFLLRHGYIDENYQIYINYFHPSSINTKEMNFILGVRNHRAVGDYTYELEHCDKIVERLESFEFGQKEILNFNLVDFILLNLPSWNVKYRRMIELLVNRTSESKSFVKAYMDREKNVTAFISAICHASRNVWFDFEYDAEITEATKEKYLLSILRNCELEDICHNEFLKEDGKAKSIKTRIENNKDILTEFSTMPIEKQKNIITSLNIMFKSLNINGLGVEILNFVFDGGYYILNQEMISHIFSIKSPELQEQLAFSNYSTICKLAYQPLIDNVRDNFVWYVTKFVIEPEENTMEKLDAIEDMLERLSDNPEMCITIIEKQNNSYWESIVDCMQGVEEKSDVWNHLLATGKVAKKWGNYIDYHKKYGLTDELCDYLDKNIVELKLEDRPDDLTDELINELLSANISLAVFEAIVDKYKVEEFTVKLTDIELERLNILIQKEYLVFSAELYIEIYNISVSQAAEFAVCNKAEFMEQISECKLNSEDIEALLKTNAFSEQEILDILAWLNPANMNSNIALKLREYTFALPRNVIDAAWDTLETDMRFELLYNQMEAFTLDELADKFKELGGPYDQFQSRVKRKYTLWCNDYNRKLCDKLRKIGFLTSCNEEEVVVGKNQDTLSEIKRMMLVGYVKQK